MYDRNSTAMTPAGVWDSRIIQGGMGIGVSNWRLARAVSKAGQIGTVSGTGVSLVLARRLQNGDPEGHVRRALSAFPFPEIVERILAKYFVPGGIAPGKPYKNVPMLKQPLSRELTQLLVAASFVEVWLAKEGHSGKVAVNYLEKIQLALLPSLYGALLAGVDLVLIGAGIPVQIPEALDRLARNETARYRLHVEESESAVEASFDPLSLPWASELPSLRRPRFFPIISSHVLAQMLLRRSNGEIDGFVVEGPSAGGHNAPPRNRKETTESGEPLYTEADAPDLVKLRGLEKPFWLAGSLASPQALQSARELGARGIQVGSIFALCTDSGVAADLREAAIERASRDELTVFTNPRSSSSGFPFKECDLPGTLSDAEVYANRERICDIGALRTLYRSPDGKIGYRCSGEPVDHYLKKGGREEDTVGKRCLCNTLLSTIGLGQSRPKTGYLEPALLTLGSDYSFLPHVLKGRTSYTAADALDYLLG